MFTAEEIARRGNPRVRRVPRDRSSLRVACRAILPLFTSSFALPRGWSAPLRREKARLVLGASKGLRSFMIFAMNRYRRTPASRRGSTCARVCMCKVTTHTPVCVCVRVWSDATARGCKGCCSYTADEVRRPDRYRSLMPQALSVYISRFEAPWLQYCHLPKPTHPEVLSKRGQNADNDQVFFVAASSQAEEKCHSDVRIRGSKNIERVVVGK